MADFVDYEILLGTFEGEDFKWKTLKKYNDFDKAYKFFHEYTNKQMQYTDEELKRIWSSGRLDIELKQGKKLLNWVAIYSRRVSELDEEEDEEKIKKPKDEDSDSENKDTKDKS